MPDVNDLAYGDLVFRLDGSVIELLMISLDGASVLGAVSY